MLSETQIFNSETTLGVVLILVLMEYALWAASNAKQCNRGWWVLILVLMEYALWGKYSYYIERWNEGLNPCFNGICSLRVTLLLSILMVFSLNPCFNGICSLRTKTMALKPSNVVLILVLMEYALWAQWMYHALMWSRVLILVLMEYALWDIRNVNHRHICSRVLILVLMEYALWALTVEQFKAAMNVS